MAKLIVISEGLNDRSFDLDDDKITIGRLPDNQIRLPDDAISSHHAELTRKGDDYILRDLNSTNGTRVNGQRIVEAQLYNGDTVHFGHLELQYYSSAKASLAPPPSLRKTVDLSSVVPGSTTQRPISYKSSSPFARNRRSKSKMFLQIAVVLLGLIAIILLAFFITKLLNS